MKCALRTQARQDEENKRLSNQKFNYMVEMGAIDPQEEELQRQQAQIDMLRDKGMQGQEGRMVGNTFVAPSITQYAAQLGNAYMARKGNEEAKAERSKIAIKRADAAGKFGNSRQNSAVDALRRKREEMGID
jgi:hypothetical protein